MARNQQNEEKNKSSKSKNKKTDSKGKRLIGLLISSKILIIIIICIIVFIVLLPAIKYYTDLNDTKEDASNKKNAPAAVRNFVNDTEIDKDGKIKLKSTILELWEKMKDENNDALKYLNTPEDLSKLISASIALDYPDTRKDPSKKINLSDIKINSNDVQGIIKFKRATQDGKIDYMTYVSPEKFQENISKYEQSHSEKDRKEALKHFTMEKVANSSTSNNGAKVPSLKGMVFMGDSILSMISIKSSEALEKEGAKTMYRGGCTAMYFLGKDTAGGQTSNCIEDGSGHFIWDENFKDITSPTGFYLFLGQNFRSDKDGRIKQMDELIKEIRSHYSQAPIFINSVFRDMDGNAEKKKKDANEMNEELKAYCEKNINNKVYYSDTLREYDESDEMFLKHTYDKDHPNEEGARIIIKNIKENIVGSSSTASTTTSSTSAPTTTSSASGSRAYNNNTLDADKTIDLHKKMAHPHNETLREFRASQAACYDGKYVIHFQNKNYGSIDASSRGGRIAWSNVETGEMDYVIETNEGGHGDGIAYDSERNVVLKCVDGSNNLLEIDNNTKKITRTY